MANWKDSTRRKYNETVESKPPTSWEFNNGQILVFLTKAHLHYPDEWIMTCSRLAIDKSPLNLLGSVDYQIAQSAAMQRVKNAAKDIYDSLLK